MITLKIKKTNINITQKIYDEYIEKVGIHTLNCSCGGHELVRHGYYNRKVKTTVGTITIRILRVKCKRCNATHAIFLSIVVPYQMIQLNIQINILKGAIDEKVLMDNNPDISEQDIKQVRKRYKKKFEKWMELERLSFEDDLVTAAYNTLNETFMQMKKIRKFVLVQST